ncbi:hypothetical protein AgCh_029333 [Apium graveolens]
MPCPEFKKIKEMLLQQSTHGQLPDKYAFKEGLLLKDGKYYVGTATDLRKKIIETLHNSSERGHSGATATTKRIELQFFGPGLK